MAEERITPAPVSPGSVGSVRVLGVPIRFHFTCVVLLIYLLAAGFNSSQSPANYTLFTLALIASVLLHEFGHALASAVCGIRTLEIMMYPIGGAARPERPLKPREEFWIALAGPVVNLLIAGIIAAVLYGRSGVVHLFALAQAGDAHLADRIVGGNLLLAYFTLLPAFPMDGGRMLRAILTRFKPEVEATRIVTWSGRALAFSIGMYGLIYLPVLALLAVFIYMGAANEGAASRGKSLTRGLPVRAAMMSEYRTLSHGNTIRDAAHLLLTTPQEDFPVMHGDQLVGLLGRNALVRAMEHEGPDSYVAGCMDREFIRVAPDQDLSEVLPLLPPSGGCALVMEGGQLLGLLTSENLSRFLSLRGAGLQPAEGAGVECHKQTV